MAANLTCTRCLQIVIAEIDDCELKTALQEFLDDIFLELPEDPQKKYWIPAAQLIEKYKDCAQFKRACQAWNEYLMEDS